MTRNTSSRYVSIAKTSLLGAVLICAVALGVSFLGSQRAAAAPLAPVTIVADTADACANKANPGGFFGLEPWYAFMPDELSAPPNCDVKCFNIFIQNQANECGQKGSDIPGVLLAVVDDLLRISGLVAIAFIIMGAFQYVASRGNPEKTAQAQSTIISALTGLAVALVAVALVSFIGSQLKGP
jgi:hypothetical protein